MSATLTPVSQRLPALDLLRGIAILAMIFSGVVPREILPAWMYHAQVGPPDHVFNPSLPGLTWVDLVFPLFLFCMGAAFPLALTPVLEAGSNVGKLVQKILTRGVALAVFAILLQHMRPHQILNPPETLTWFLALLGLLILFGAYSRYPLAFLKTRESWIRPGFWLLLFLWIPFYSWVAPTPFSLTRSDIILIVLANMAIFAALIWLFTRDQVLLRLGLLALYLALRLAHAQSPWMQSFWSFSPIPWFFHWDYLKYLFIVLPGTFAGEILLSQRRSDLAGMGSSKAFYWSLLSLAILFMSLVGYQSRWLLGTTLILIMLTALSLYLSRRESRNEIRQLVYWGAFWLLLGLLLEPFEGGIKKDPSTLSYYFLTSGIACYLLASFQAWGPGLGLGRFLGLLMDNGRNPMLAYVTMANFIWPLMALTGLETLLGRFHGQVLPTLTIAILKTLLLAFLVQWVTRRGWSWKT